MWKIVSDGNWVMKANGCEKLSDEWWVMSDEWWVMEIEWPFFVGQTGSKFFQNALFNRFYQTLRACLVNVFKNWKLLFKNMCGNTCEWKSAWKYVWMKKCVKIHIILFKNWKLLFENTNQTPPYFLKNHFFKKSNFKKLNQTHPNRSSTWTVTLIWEAGKKNLQYRLNCSWHMGQSWTETKLLL